MKSLQEINDEFFMSRIFNPEKFRRELEEIRIRRKMRNSKVAKHPHFKGETVLGVSRNYKTTNEFEDESEE